MNRAPTLCVLPRLPISTIVLIGLLAVIALAGLAGCGGGGPEDRLDSPEAIRQGRELFVVNCAQCHGDRGDGQGPRAAVLVKQPTDFTDPVWRAGAQPRAVFSAIRVGVQGSAMPAWPAFTEKETWDLVAYVLSLADDRGDGR